MAKFFSLKVDEMDNNNDIFQDQQFFYEQSFENIRANDPEDLIANNQALFSIMDNIPNGVTILTPDLKIVYTNKKMRKWFAGNKRNYKIKCYRLFHNQKVPCENCPSKACMKTLKSASVFHDCGIDEKTGQPMYMHIHSFPILNDSGKITAIIEYSYNLTEQRRNRIYTETLESQCRLLGHENTLLKKELAELQNDFQELESTVNDNMNNHVRPALEYLKMRLSAEERKIFTSILEEAIFPITRKNTSKVVNLSSRELQIAMLVKEGISSKQIADDLCITKKAVDYHRANIRKKLKISPDANLQAYLRAYL